MNSEEFNFEPITESGITYYIIPKGTVLYHGSNNISTPEQLQERRHTFFALTNEYASKYAKETGKLEVIGYDTGHFGRKVLSVRLVPHILESGDQYW